jgi:formate dehydrogenase iron-sulfur subunit
MSNTTQKGKYGFLIDASLCIDCRSCLVACSTENNVSMTSTRIWMKETGVQGLFPNLSRYSAPFHCMHCDDPSCVSACTVGALQRNEDGIVVYDAKRCIGCRYCMYACPFGVPNMDLGEQLPLIVKCDMCEERLEEGLQPACAATCLTGAISFGIREEMLEKAHQRMAENPTLCDHIYGEHENGGTSTLYLSPISCDQLCFPCVGTHSTAYSNRQVTETTPAVAGIAAVVLSGIFLAFRQFGNPDKNSEEDPENTEEIRS